MENLSDHQECVEQRRHFYVNSAKLVVFIEFCERICYYSILGNLLLYCIAVMQIGKIDALLVVFLFTGIF